MNDLDRDVTGAAHAHQRLLADVDQLTEAQLREPARLPGWSVAHVLAHLAGNAEGFVRMVEAADRGEQAEQYVGGAETRNRDIEQRATLPLTELVHLVRRTIWQLEGAWATCTAAGWQGTGISMAGPMPIADLPFRRWRETVVHHADLGLAYTWRDWPAEYVRLELARLTMLWASRRPMGLTELPAEVLSVPDAHRVAWLLGRAAIDGLPPAGIFG
jgi:maleylpyruvate isomerase